MINELRKILLFTIIVIFGIVMFYLGGVSYKENTKSTEPEFTALYEPALNEFMYKLVDGNTTCYVIPGVDIFCK